MSQEGLSPEVRQALIDIVGREGYSDSLIDLVSGATDASEYTVRPRVVVWPITTEQTAAIMTLAHDKGIPVTPRGAGTGLTGMAVPMQGGVVIDFARMNKILDIRVADRLAVVQPGVVYADLQKALAVHDFFYPPDPASGPVSTIGGNVATNAGGLRGAKYGVTRDYVLGLEVVLPDGRVMRTGSRTMKCVSGFDLTRLMVGSEGMLGLITEITLKINPKPLSRAAALAVFPSLGAAGRAVTGIMKSGVIPAVCELLERQTINLVRSHTDMDIPEAEAMLLVECDSLTEAEADFQIDRVTAEFEAEGAMMIRRASEEADIEALWQARRAASAGISRVAPNGLAEDITVPISRLAEAVEGAAEIGKKHNLTIIQFAHAGDGNLHPVIMYHADDKDETSRVPAAAADIFRMACDLGGTLTGEHGIGLSKAPFMTWEHDTTAIEVMRGLKRFFDPDNILNPGKMGFD